MKKRALLLCVTCLLFAGCGDPLIEMTAEQSDTLSTYAAGILLKYSTAGKDGLMYLDPSVYAAREEEHQPVEVTFEEPKEEKGTEEDGYLSDDAERLEAAAPTPISDVYDFGGADFSITGYEIKDSYVEGDYFSLLPGAGKKFLTLHLQLSNEGSETAAVSIAEDGVSFTLLINGKSVKAESSFFLENDMTVLKTKLSSGEMKEAFLIFEVNEADANAIESLVLQASRAGKTGSMGIIAAE